MAYYPPPAPRPRDWWSLVGLALMVACAWLTVWFILVVTP